MLEQLQDGVMPVLVQAILSIAGIFITTLTAVAIEYIKKKKESLVIKIGADNYNQNYNIAKGIYFIVENQFKDIKNVADKKRAVFDQLLLQQIPYLTQDELNSYRERIVGEINTIVKDSKVLDAVKPK